MNKLRITFQQLRNLPVNKKNKKYKVTVKQN